MKSKFEVTFDYKVKYQEEPFPHQALLWLSVEQKLLSLCCPHCQVYTVMQQDSSVERFERDEEGSISQDNEILAFDFICTCPQCKNTVFVQAKADMKDIFPLKLANEACKELDKYSGGEVVAIHPYKTKVEISPEVPEEYANDFSEALLIVDLSPMASAALCRRILQNILRNEFNIKPDNLCKEIGDFIEKEGIPSYLTEAVDAIRNIGNIAAHPMKNKRTGEIVNVEPGEAEWLIEVLESLFDFTFIQPKKIQERKEKLNNKLQYLGKPPMK